MFAKFMNKKKNSRQPNYLVPRGPNVFERLVRDLTEQGAALAEEQRQQHQRQHQQTRQLVTEHEQHLYTAFPNIKAMWAQERDGNRLVPKMYLRFDIASSLLTIGLVDRSDPRYPPVECLSTPLELFVSIKVAANTTDEDGKYRVQLTFALSSRCPVTGSLVKHISVWMTEREQDRLMAYLRAHDLISRRRPAHSERPCRLYAALKPHWEWDALKKSQSVARPGSSSDVAADTAAGESSGARKKTVMWADQLSEGRPLHTTRHI